MSLQAATAFVRVFRAISRLREATLPENKRARLRQLRHRLEALDSDRDVLLERMKGAQGWERLDLLDEFRERHADARTREGLRPHQENLRQIRQEGESLQAIHHQAAGDWAAAVAGYQEYIRGHPESDAGYSYLGGALKKVGDLEGSLTAYREAVRLSADRPVPSGSARISVATVLHALGRTDTAIAELHGLIDTAHIQNEAVVCLAYNQIGDILLDTGDRKAARRAWKQAIKRDTTPTQIVAKKVRERIAANR